MPHISHQVDQPILNVHHLSVQYGDFIALEDVTFHLHVGERIAVVGPNGAGKSTLFKVIAGVIRPTAGEVHVYGSSPAHHICIGYVPQRSQVEWHFPVTVEDVVMMGRVAQIGLFRHPKKADWQRVHEALETVGLLDLARRPIEALSGGQQQRMFIARALAQDAELLLMDEPLNGLDIPSQESILSLLDRLRSQGITLMIATHDLEQAANFFDKVMLLNRRLIGFGKPQDVLRPDRLLRAYGGKLQIVEEAGNLLAVGDTCCEEPFPHEHS